MITQQAAEDTSGVRRVFVSANCLSSAWEASGKHSAEMEMEMCDRTDRPATGD